MKLVRVLQEQEKAKERERYAKYVKKQLMVNDKEHKFWNTQVHLQRNDSELVTSYLTEFSLPKACSEFGRYCS